MDPVAETDAAQKASPRPSIARLVEHEKGKTWKQFPQILAIPVEEASYTHTHKTTRAHTHTRKKRPTRSG